MNLVSQEAPYVVRDKQTGKYRGFCIDLLDLIAEKRKFNYSIYDVGTYGTFNSKNETWNGVMAELIHRVSETY